MREPARAAVTNRLADAERKPMRGALDRLARLRRDHIHQIGLHCAHRDDASLPAMKSLAIFPSRNASDIQLPSAMSGA